jgi:hypothetical protein
VSYASRHAAIDQSVDDIFKPNRHLHVVADRVAVEVRVVESGRAVPVEQLGEMPQGLDHRGLASVVLASQDRYVSAKRYRTSAHARKFVILISEIYNVRVPSG